MTNQFSAHRARNPTQSTVCRSERFKERLTRAFAAAIANLTEYIPGPDMGTDELAMG
jgi:hypothetical protein